MLLPQAKVQSLGVKTNGASPSNSGDALV